MTSDTMIELCVERPAVGGRMIARLDGRIVLVAGAIPGERIRAEVERSRGGVVLARTVEILEGSRDRRPVAGVPACGGRSFAHIAYRRQLELKSQIVQDAFRRIGRIDLAVPPPVVPSIERGYRMRARLHVGDSLVGFLEAGSHRVCDVSRLGPLLPKTERLIGAFATHAPALGAVGAKMVELAEEGMTMLVVTHEMGFAKTVANRVIFMDEGEIIEQNEPHEFFNNPQSDRTKLFLSQILHN